KVRSLIGAFANNNLVNFHRKDGAGYRFLADRVIELNLMNPQIASRLVTPLTRWRKFNPARQEMMKAELARILEQDKLSPDVYEVVSKALAACGCFRPLPSRQRAVQRGTQNFSHTQLHPEQPASPRRFSTHRTNYKRLPTSHWWPARFLLR